MNEIVTYIPADPYEKGKSPLIRNLMPGLTEIGKIKIGRKGELRTGPNGQWRVPVRLDHFIVTTLERDKDDNFIQNATIMKLLGEKPKRIPICLLFDSIEANFQSRYSCYNGKTLWCSGDGVRAYRQVKLNSPREPVDCPCGREQPDHKGKDKCKINGCLSCMINGADTVGGIFKYRTTGYNSTVGIMSSLSLIRAMTGGLLAGLDLALTVQPKVGTDPDGKSVTIQVVGVEFNGSIQTLHKKALQIATENADFRMRLAHVEDDVKRLIGVDTEAIDQAADITEEFYPEDEPTPKLAEPTVAAPASISPTTLPPTTPPPAKAKRAKKTETAPVVEPAPTPAPVPPPIAVPAGSDVNLFDMGDE
ncbi:MAG: hypothetical protein WBM07_10995 [Chitinivibrionales bacterium]